MGSEMCIRDRYSILTLPRLRSRVRTSFPAPAFIAVDPSKQGQGIGSFLLKEALKMVDKNGDRAYLEASSERNKALYERHGFEMIGEVQVDDSPSAYPMIREPRK